uniref:Putative secreted protein n=1 Tax=Ixodes ricinus TaxID=34613 RepID=A0A6B0TZC5_IXORI
MVAGAALLVAAPSARSGAARRFSLLLALIPSVMPGFLRFRMAKMEDSRSGNGGISSSTVASTSGEAI